MTPRKKAADGFVWALLGLAIIGWLAFHIAWWPHYRYLTILLGIVMVAVSDIWPLKLGRGSISLASAGYFSVFITAGLPAASFALLGGLFLSALKQPRGLLSLFNMAQFILSLFAAALVYRVLEGHVWLAIVGFVVATVVVNHLLVNAYYYILEGKAALGDIFPALGLDGIGWIISAPLIGIFVLLDRAYLGPGALLAIFPFLFVTWLLGAVYQTRRAHKNTMVVASLSMGIAKAPNRPTIYRLIEQSLREIMDVSVLVVYGLDGDPNQLTREWTLYPVAEQVPYGDSLRPEEGIAGWVMESQSPEMVLDSFQLPSRLAHPGDPYPVRSALMLPMVTEGQLMGVMVVGHVRPQVYDRFDLQLGMIIAGQAAIAFRKIELGAEATRLSMVDPLIPNLFNYRHFRAVLEAELESQKLGKRPFCVAFLDMDRFKLVNDRYGHLRGDEVLRQFVSVVRREIRSYDILARYGGDEFVLLLTDINENGVQVLLNRIQEIIGTFVFDHVEIFLGVSIGYALYPQDGETVEALLSAADQRMYENKSARHRASKSLTTAQDPA